MDTRKVVTWSHSSLKDFETCPRKYHEVKVLNKYPREDTQATLYGTKLHEVCELHIRDGAPLPLEFKFLQPMLDRLVGMPGTKYTELEMALTKTVQVCDFHDEGRWVRGIADLVVVDGATARVWDYKSGSDKYPDTTQLELMALMVFAHFPEVKSVTGGLLFVLKNTVYKMKRMQREDQHALWWRYRERVVRIERAHETGVWNPVQSGLCKKYCPVVDCVFNGRA